MCSLAFVPVYTLSLLSIYPRTQAKSQYHDLGSHSLRGSEGHVPDLIPHGGGQGGHGQDCHVEYEEVCQTSYDQQCSNSYKESCCDHCKVIQHISDF